MKIVDTHVHRVTWGIWTVISMREGYRIKLFGALSTFKYIALSDSVGKNVSAAVDTICRALAVATHSATGAVGRL